MVESEATHRPCTKGATGGVRPGPATPCPRVPPASLPGRGGAGCCNFMTSRTQPASPPPWDSPRAPAAPPGAGSAQHGVAREQGVSRAQLEHLALDRARALGVVRPLEHLRDPVGAPPPL